jgi:aspartate kinase
MLVFKFGGASVKNADAVKNVGKILEKYTGEEIAIVISAMGKTTNALEVVADHYFHRKSKEMRKAFDEVREYHMDIVKKLFTNQDDDIFKEIGEWFEEINARLSKPRTLNYDFDYDQIVSYGEILSTVIISAWLNSKGQENRWIDIRKYLKSDNNYREGRIDWELSTKLIRHAFHFRDTRLYVTQGFIASTIDDMTTT